MNDQQTTRYISTTDTAKQIRKTLRAQWPGVKFSVRKGAGTASAWIGVSWEDGPRAKDVTALVSRFEGARFNGMTDSYDHQPDQLVATKTGERPEIINYHCDGINTHRSISDDATRYAAQRIANQNPALFTTGVPDFAVMDGRAIRAALLLVQLTEDYVIYNHHAFPNRYNDLGLIVDSACHHTDFTIDYDADQRCTLCGERTEHPHDPMCPKTDVH
jgi:hypothetical protein